MVGPQLVAAWLAKKALVFVAANIYGIPKLYRRSLELNNKVRHRTHCLVSQHLWQLFSPQGRAHGRVKHLIRHTFDFTVTLSRTLVHTCKLRVDPIDLSDAERTALLRRYVPPDSWTDNDGHIL